MSKGWVIGFFSACLLCSFNARAELLLYGPALCGDSVTFYCLEVGDTIVKKEIKTKTGTVIKERKVVETWEMLWPDEREREIVKRINRRNTTLARKTRLAVPRDMAGKTYMDYSPYPLQIDAPGQEMIIWDPGLLAYGAYDAAGMLVRWGPAAGGKDYCPDVERGCRTRVGEFKIISKGGPNYRSGKYPVGCEGNKCALMPYAMFFKSGYAFHAGRVPGANASHGCVRLFYSDAEWLNKEMVKVGCKVIIRPYPQAPARPKHRAPRAVPASTPVAAAAPAARTGVPPTPVAPAPVVPAPVVPAPAPAAPTPAPR